MALQIGLECAGLLFTVEGNSSLNFPRMERHRGGDCASVVTGKAFLKVCRESRVVRGLRCYIGKNIDIKERHCEYVMRFGKGIFASNCLAPFRPLCRLGYAICPTWRAWGGVAGVVCPASPSPALRAWLRRGTFSNAEGAAFAAPSAFEKVVERLPRKST